MGEDGYNIGCVVLVDAESYVVGIPALVSNSSTNPQEVRFPTHDFLNILGNGFEKAEDLHAYVSRCLEGVAAELDKGLSILEKDPRLRVRFVDHTLEQISEEITRKPKPPLERAQTHPLDPTQTLGLDVFPSRTDEGWKHSDRDYL